MKVHIEIDCTPEEARRFMGLPDVEKTNAIYVDAISNAMKGAANMDQMQEFARQIAPMGQLGLKLFQDFMKQGGAAFSDGEQGSGAKDNSPKS